MSRPYDCCLDGQTRLLWWTIRGTRFERRPPPIPCPAMAMLQRCRYGWATQPSRAPAPMTAARRCPRTRQHSGHAPTRRRQPFDRYTDRRHHSEEEWAKKGGRSHLFHLSNGLRPIHCRRKRGDALDSLDTRLSRLLGGVNLRVAQLFAVCCLEVPEVATGCGTEDFKHDDFRNVAERKPPLPAKRSMRSRATAHPMWA